MFEKNGHCRFSLSRRTFRGEPKKGRSLRKKKFDFPLDNLLRKRLNERPFPLHGGVSISKFFDSHLICAIDTVSVQYNKPLPTVSLLRTDLFFVRVLLGEESK